MRRHSGRSNSIRSNLSMHWRPRILQRQTLKCYRRRFETGGENLLSGLTNLLNDLQRGKGSLSVTMTDMNAFRLGENIATTPGKVVLKRSHSKNPAEISLRCLVRCEPLRGR
jgi:poly(3-hydroxyalkanoate) synthetase